MKKEEKNNPIYSNWLHHFGTHYNKKVIETMNKLGYSLKAIYDGLAHKEKAIVDTYNWLMEEKRWAEEF